MYVNLYFVEYPNGATGTFITCTHDILGTDRFEIHGDKGKILVEGSKKVTVKFLASSSILLFSSDKYKSSLNGNSTSLPNTFTTL